MARSPVHPHESVTCAYTNQHSSVNQRLNPAPASRKVKPRPHSHR
ncbi:hypothetical protein RM6536_1118 [Rothia mucilaginosa]|uniref:Uncharacterized protein n=1 Tax=Rothia mucilaginosa TaxID=43675 RepID=A0A0K2RZZ3_9MICC|nr:hypothetical protein RM6536_1118 [Rothia mucilaginosa]